MNTLTTFPLASKQTLVSQTGTIFCLCVFVSLFFCVSVYLCLLSLCLCVFVSLCLCAFVFVCLCVFVSLCLCAFVFVCLCVCVFMFVCLCVFMFVCLCDFQTLYKASHVSQFKIFVQFVSFCFHSRLIQYFFFTLFHFILLFCFGEFLFKSIFPVKPFHLLHLILH